MGIWIFGGIVLFGLFYGVVPLSQMLTGEYHKGLTHLIQGLFAALFTFFVLVGVFFAMIVTHDDALGSPATSLALGHYYVYGVRHDAASQRTYFVLANTRKNGVGADQFVVLSDRRISNDSVLWIGATVGVGRVKTCMPDQRCHWQYRFVLDPKLEPCPVGLGIKCTFPPPSCPERIPSWCRPIPCPQTDETYPCPPRIMPMPHPTCTPLPARNPDSGIVCPAA